MIQKMMKRILIQKKKHKFKRRSNMKEIKEEFNGKYCLI